MQCCVAFLPFGRLTLNALKPLPFPEAPKTLGEHLRRRRGELALQQKEVARQMRVSPFTLLGWEKDRTEPPVCLYPRIIEFLGYDPSPAPRSFGDRIEAARRQLGLSQEAAAKILGIDEGTLRRYEHGTWTPKGERLARIDKFVRGDADGRER